MRWEISKVPAGYVFWAGPSGFQPGVRKGYVTGSYDLAVISWAFFWFQLLSAPLLAFRPFRARLREIVGGFGSQTSVQELHLTLDQDENDNHD